MKDKFCSSFILPKTLCFFSQIGGATDPMTTPTRPKKSQTKRAINKKLTPRKGKIYAA